MDFFKVQKEFSKVKEGFKNLKDSNLEKFIFYNKKNFKESKVIYGKKLSDSLIEFNSHLPKELDLNKEYLFLDNEGNFLMINGKVTIDYKDVNLFNKKIKKEITRANYKKVKISFDED